MGFDLIAAKATDCEISQPQNVINIKRNNGMWLIVVHVPGEEHPLAIASTSLRLALQSVPASAWYVSVTQQ